MCTNFNVFLQEDKETADMCINVIVFPRRRKRLQTCVLMSLFSPGGERDCRHVY